MASVKRVVLLQPASAGGNFEYIAIPRQGMLFLSGALLLLPLKPDIRDSLPSGQLPRAPA